VTNITASLLHSFTASRDRLPAFLAAIALLLSHAARADDPAIPDAARAQALSAVLPYLVQPGTTPPAAAPAPRSADFGRERPSPDARHVADWIAGSGDNAGADFVIVDKKQARIYVFDAGARLRGATPVLLGGARGDHTVPGIGSKPIAKVRPEEKTTPAGRFLGERGRNARGEDVVWVDYDAGVSMHRVLTTNPKERRLERLATPTVQDNRISYGCINVPVLFYEAYIRPTFAARRAPVYVLPEVRTAREVFGSYDVTLRRAAADSME
jgi:hypothetical protein